MTPDALTAALPVLLPLLLAAAVAILAPLPLTSGAWRIRRPRLALGAWLGAISLGAGLLLASLAAALIELAARTANGLLLGVGVTVFAWLGLASIGALLALGASRLETISAADRSLELHVELLAASAARRVWMHRSAEVCLVDAGETELALACRSGVPRILLTTALEAKLTPTQLRAVIEHEFAHLRGQHDRLLRLARLNAACFPWLRASRSFEREARLLVELAADDAAASVVGPAELAATLAALHAQPGCEEGLRLRAARLGQTPARAANTRATAPKPEHA